MLLKFEIIAFDVSDKNDVKYLLLFQMLCII